MPQYRRIFVPGGDILFHDDLMELLTDHFTRSPAWQMDLDWPYDIMRHKEMH